MKTRIFYVYLLKDPRGVEQEAFDHEIELIAALAGLTNILRGGQGWALTPQEADRRLAIRELGLMAEREVQNIAWLRIWVASVEAWPGVVFPDMKNGFVRAAEFVKTVHEIVDRYDARMAA